MKYLNAFQFETINVHSLSSLSKDVFADAIEAWMTLQGGDIRYRYDGGIPTPLDGHILRSGDTLRLHGGIQISKFMASPCADKVGILSVSYERE